MLTVFLTAEHSCSVLQHGHTRDVDVLCGPPCSIFTTRAPSRALDHLSRRRRPSVDASFVQVIEFTIFSKQLQVHPCWASIPHRPLGLPNVRLTHRSFGCFR